jgi:hypothetical protein
MNMARLFAPVLLVVGFGTLGYLGLRYTLGPQDTSHQTNALPLAAGGIALAGGIASLVYSVKRQRAAVTLQHGCRAEYGPLELRIQTSTRANRFLICVEDPRQEHRVVYKQKVQSTLESAKEYAALRANEYLSSYGEAARPDVEWSCS